MAALTVFSGCSNIPAISAYVYPSMSRKMTAARIESGSRLIAARSSDCSSAHSARPAGESGVSRAAASSSDVCGLRLYVIRENTGAIETYRNLGMTVSDYLLCEDDWAE